MLVDPQDLGTEVIHALPDFDLEQLLVPALDGGGSQSFALSQRALRDPSMMGLEDLSAERLGRAPASADPWKALVEIPSAALAVEFMALEVKIRRPGPKVGVSQHPDEAVLHPKLNPLAPRTTHRSQVPGMQSDRLRPLDAFDFKLRQSHYNGICGVHGILLTS